MKIDLEKYEGVQRWFASAHGQSYRDQEIAQYEQCLKGKKGNTLLLPHLSCLQGSSSLDQFTQHHYFELQDLTKPLAIPDRAFDCILLPHVLEFCSEPYLIMKEAARLLNPEGLLIISGFSSKWYLFLLALFGHAPDKALADLSPISKHYVTQWGADAHLSSVKVQEFGSKSLPFLSFITAGYLCSFKHKEYFVKPLRTESLTSSLPLLGTPNLALNTEKSQQ